MDNLKSNDCITPKELRELIVVKKQTVKIIDVRSKEEYDLSHIPGAININVVDIELADKFLDKNDFIITACGKGGGRSINAAKKLEVLGFENTWWLCGGTFGWMGC